MPSMIILTSVQLLQPPPLLLHFQPPLSRDSLSVITFDFVPQTALEFKLKQIPILVLLHIGLFCEVLVHSRPGRSFSHEEGVDKKGSDAKYGVGASWSTGQVVTSANLGTSQHQKLVG